MSFFDTRCPSQAVERALACQAVGKFSRASSAGGRLNLRSSIKQLDRVGRRGLFEPREDFSRLPTHTIRGCIRGSIRGSLSVALALACPAVGKFSRASSAGGRLNLRSNIKQPDRVGRRGLSEPREDFSRLPTYANPWLYPWLYPWLHPWLDDLLHSFNGFQPHSAHLQAFRLTANIPYHWTEKSVEHCQINFLKSWFHRLIHKWSRNQ